MSMQAPRTPCFTSWAPASSQILGARWYSTSRGKRLASSGWFIKIQSPASDLPSVPATKTWSPGFAALRRSEILPSVVPRSVVENIPTSPTTVSPPISVIPLLSKPCATAFAILFRVSSLQFLFTQSPNNAILGRPPMEDTSETLDTMCFSTACSGLDQSKRKCVFSTERSLVASQPSKMAQSSPALSQLRCTGDSFFKG